VFKVEEGVRFWTLVKKILASLRYDKTKDIDGVDALGERLIVRGKDLNTLIGSISFTEALFHILLNRMPSDVEKNIFDAVLVSFHAGFGFSTPSVLLPRLAATTGSSMASSLAAGYSAGGQYHIGAVEQAMKMFKDILNSKGENINEHVKNYLRKTMDEGKMIHGFGHPLFRRDPRPSQLRVVLKKYDYITDYVRIYDVAEEYLSKEKNIHPNIDGINAVILLSLGFTEDHGTGLFLLSRTSAMIAHVAEEKTKEPFYTDRRLYPILRLLERERDEKEKVGSV